MHNETNDDKRWTDGQIDCSNSARKKKRDRKHTATDFGEKISNYSLS